MKAIVYEKYGTAEVLKLREVAKPIPEDDELLVKVRASSINDWDWGLLTGKPFINRIDNGLLKPKKYKILGSDIAGIVEAVGKKVSRFKLGDEVYGDLTGKWGGFAEYACAQENMLAIKPSSMSFVQASAIPQAAMLAVQGLIDKGQLQSGQKILINGAGGGVGTFGVQIAKLHGNQVTGVDNTAKLEMMRSVGFDHVIDYTRKDFTRNKETYDIILDNKSNRSIFAYLPSLNPKGKYVTTGGSMARLLQIAIIGPIISILSKKKIHIVLLKPNKDLAYMSAQFSAGNVTPVVDGPYKLAELPELMRYYGEAKHKGKIVITM